MTGTIALRDSSQGKKNNNGQILLKIKALEILKIEKRDK